MIDRMAVKSVSAAVLMLGLSMGVQASIVYTTLLTGTAENPSNASPGSGSATVAYDAVAHTLQVSANFSSLTGTTTAAHIHCCIAAPGNVGVATMTPSFIGFPLGVTSGDYSQTFDLTQATSFNASFISSNGGTVSSAEAVLAAGLAGGQAYFNIHTSSFAGGEIRGFLAPVPLPATVWLFGSGLLGIVGMMRRR